MQFAVELMHTSKAFHSMVCKRLEIISHEDIDTQSQPHVVPFVATAVHRRCDGMTPTSWARHAWQSATPFG